MYIPAVTGQELAKPLQAIHSRRQHNWCAVTQTAGGGFLGDSVNSYMVGHIQRGTKDPNQDPRQLVNEAF